MNKGPIDPIAALAVLLATSPGAYAVFLGSGVSAGVVLTAKELRLDTLRTLYTAQETRKPAPSVDLERWWDERGGDTPTYSSMLAQAFPRPQERRAYLAGHFEGKQSTAVHQNLARLAKQQLVKVFLTTNLDRLLEQALEAEGLRVASVAIGEHVAAMPPREHVDAYVLHLHGDYTSERMRNTADELEALDPEIEREFTDILRTHGLLFLGYAGEDPAVARVLKATAARFSVFWCVRSEPTRAQLEIGTPLRAAWPRADDIGAFIEDLMRRVDALRLQPDARLPVDEYRDALKSLDDGHEAQVERQARRLGKNLSRAVKTWVDENRNGFQPSPVPPEQAAQAWRGLTIPLLDSVAPSLHAFVAGAGAAIESSSAAALAPFIDLLVGLFRSTTPGGSTRIAMAPQFVARVAAEVLMARAVSLRRWLAFEAICAPVLLEYDGTSWPWVYLTGYVYPAFVGTEALVPGFVVREVIAAEGELNEALQLDAEAASLAAADANILLGVVYQAYRERNENLDVLFFWGFRHGPSEELFDHLLSDEAALPMLARLAQEDEQTFRSKFKERFLSRMQSSNEGSSVHVWRWTNSAELGRFSQRQ